MPENIFVGASYREGDRVDNRMRASLKLELMKEAKFNPICPLCQRRASQLHEIICPPLEDGKYHPNPVGLSEWVYLPQNCILLCHNCNVRIGSGSSAMDVLIQHNMKVYGPEQVIAVYRGMANYLRVPTAYIPMSIEFEGKLYRIL